MGKVITVAMHKGGVGKTTLITSLGGAITHMSKKAKILIIDLDGQANVTAAFGDKVESYDGTVEDIILNRRPAKECIHNLFKNIDVIPAGEDMDFIELDIFEEEALRSKPFYLLEEAIGELKNEYDLIFIDTPPSISLMLGNALTVADKVIIPFQPEVFGVKGLVRIIELIRKMNLRLGLNVDILGVVGMFYRKGTSLHSETVQQARQYCAVNDIHMFDTVIPQATRYSNAVSKEGLPATITDLRKMKLFKKSQTTHEASEAYYDLLIEIENRDSDIKESVNNG
ncbi:ParA family protein [Alkalicoccobacillus gibsonii]|uniref:ParA family protein n=1 Tax=Alkalicoccobacillus gibsonii TaxID=79881 RepID=UPI003519799C